MSKKIFYALSVFLLLGVTMSALSVRAHPPINIDIEYYVADGELAIRLTHGVSDPKVHYIYEIDVWVNVTQVWEDHHHEQHYSDLDNYAVAIRPLVAPNYTFAYTEQPTQVTPITVSHTIAIYRLSLPGLQKTGDVIDNPPYDDNFERYVPFLGEGRTNITVDLKCSLGGSLTEHYYVGLPYYNPHLSFAEAAMPALISTLVVAILLYTLPMLGQKNLPKLEAKRILQTK
ncbi:MAG: hypothetical protein ACTSO6_07080 [Promethearchaeota archaeon]